MSAKKVCAKRLRQMKKSRAKWNFFAHLALGSGSPEWPVCPAKTQISLGICPVWSESSLSEWRNIGPLTTYWAQSENWMLRLIWVFAGRTCHFVCFVVRQFKYCKILKNWDIPKNCCNYCKFEQCSFTMIEYFIEKPSADRLVNSV